MLGEELGWPLLNSVLVGTRHISICNPPISLHNVQLLPHDFP